jgi:hypothetical protein
VHNEELDKSFKSRPLGSLTVGESLLADVMTVDDTDFDFENSQSGVVVLGAMTTIEYNEGDSNEREGIQGD